jgi:hypothetical protein
VESIDYATCLKYSPSLDDLMINEYSQTYSNKPSRKTTSGGTRKPKVSKPTKTITMNINMADDSDDKVIIVESKNKSKEECGSVRTSITSKKTPINDSNSRGLSNTKTTNLPNSDKTKEVTSSNPKIKKSKYLKVQGMKNCKSQRCFEENPIYSHGKFNRLKRIKRSLDRQEIISNDIKQIKEQIDKK